MTPATSRRPYLLRAMHEWMTDNGQTPHIVVDPGVAGVEVPEQHVEEGKIILNLSYAATSGLRLGNELIEFEARFAGVARNVSIPVQGVLGIYARETGQGMIFTEEDPTPEPPDGDVGGEPRRSHLKVVK